MNALILDCETTGLVDPRPVEVAWLRLRDSIGLGIAESFCQRYNPDKPIDCAAMAQHHILPRDVEDAPLWSEFTLPPGVEYLIGHNVDYDWQVIGAPPVKRICTLALARALWPTLSSHSLGALLYAIDPEYAQENLRGWQHTAKGDAHATYFVVYDMLRSGRGGAIDSWEALWAWSEQARIPTVMPVGKHKGMAINDLPADYTRWFLRQPDVDPYLRQALLSSARLIADSEALPPGASRG